MYERRKSKSELAAGVSVGYCKQCDHKYYSGRYRRRQQQCGCSSCVARRVEEQLGKEQALREKICEYWKPRVADAIPYENLDIQEKIYLLSLINAQADLSLSIVKSVLERKRDVWFAPSESLENEILVLLYRRRIIVVDPESPISAFDSDKVESASAVAVRWIINVKLSGEPRSSVEDIQRQITKELAITTSDFDAHQVKSLAVSVLTEQAMRQIHYQCDRCSLPFTAEKKGRDVVSSLLLNYNLAVVNYFAYLAVRRADDYYKGATVSKTRASNIIPGKMHEYGVRAEGEAWDLKSKRYLSNDPRSELNKVVFDLVLRAEDSGFYKKVGEYFSSEPNAKTKNAALIFSCPACGSDAVHASAGEKGVVVDCKDCMARSPVQLAHTTA